MNRLSVIISVVAIVISGTLIYNVKTKPKVTEYQQGYYDGYIEALKLLPPLEPVPKAEPRCTAKAAAMWWTHTTNMKEAKRKLCS